MTTMTTIRVGTDLRDKLKTYAEQHDLTLAASIARLLKEEEERAFWDALAAITPQEYKAAAVDDGDWPGDDDHSIEMAPVVDDESRP